MGFKPKNQELLEETYRNIDEMSRLTTLDRHVSIKIERARVQLADVRARKSALRKRNEEIDQILIGQRVGKSLTVWRNDIRSYQPEIMQDSKTAA